MRQLRLDTSLITALLVALGVGLTIGLQTMLTQLVGRSVGLIQTGFWIHFGGALVGAFVVAIILLWQRHDLRSLALTPTSTAYVMLAGTIGIIILAGIGYAFPRTGQTVGQATLIFGQILIAIVIDASGLISKEPIPLDMRRVVGLVILVIAIYLLLPRQ